MGEKLTKAQLAAFSRAVLRSLWEGYPFDGEEIQDAALKHGLIHQVAFDPKVHVDHEGVGVEPGEDWYVEHPDLGRAALQQGKQP